MNKRKLFACAVSSAAVAHTASAQRTDKIFLRGNPAGTQTVQQQPDGSVRAEYSYNDRGRGEHIVATWKLDADGLPIEYHGSGNDYMKAPVEERFQMKNGRATWKNRSEEGDQPVSGKAFYLPMEAPPEFTAVLARGLLKAPNQKLALLPAGEASIEASEKLSAGKTELTRLAHHRSRVYAANHLARVQRWHGNGRQLVVGRVRSASSIHSKVARGAGENRRRIPWPCARSAIVGTWQCPKLALFSHLGVGRNVIALVGRQFA